MKEKLFAMAALAALTVAGTTGCSNNDEALGLTSKAVIGYSVSHDGTLSTRGTETTSGNYTTQIKNFQVFGYYSDGSGLYVGTSDTEGTVINGNDGSWDYADESEKKYWPDGTLDFQAITPAADASFTLANTPASGSPRLTANVTVPTAVANQKDIMFASAQNVNNAEGGLPVSLTFKHALSQVVFAGKVAGNNIKADIASIELVNIHNTGNVGYRSAVNTLAAEATGNAAATFGVGLVTSPSVTSTDAVTLTANDGALMMIPQTVAKWTTTAEAPVSIGEANENHNSYLKIKCTVTDDEKKLIDDQYVYIPFEVNWEIGKKYTYTLIFGGTSGGFDEDGKPLTGQTAITFEVAGVDNWTAADGGEEHVGVGSEEAATAGATVSIGGWTLED